MKAFQKIYWQKGKRTGSFFFFSILLLKSLACFVLEDFFSTFYLGKGGGGRGEECEGEGGGGGRREGVGVA